MVGFFRKQDPNPEPMPKPDSEAEQAEVVRVKCKVGMMILERLTDPTEDHADQRKRYEGIRDECLTLVDQIHDEFYRGFATHMLIDLCNAGGDQLVAKALLISVRDSFLREQVLRPR
jgi:hypothetical protein